MARVFLQKKGEYIFLVFYCRKHRVLVSSGVSLREKFWEQDFVSRNHPEYPLIARKLTDCLRIAEGVTKLLPEDASATEVKEGYLRIMRKKEQQDIRELGLHIRYNFIADFKAFIEKRKALFRKNTIKKYFTTLNTLLDFEAHAGFRLDIETLNKLVFEQFIAFLILQKNLLNNTVAKHVAVLKTFVKDTYPDSDTSFIRYREYRPEVIALTEDELIYLTKIPFTGKKELAKDLFVFLSITGMRISDAKRFQQEWITKEFIEYSAEKTMSKAYVPLFETAKGILAKYGGNPPVMCEQYFNRTIKQVFFDCELDRPVVIRDRQGRRMIEKVYALHEVVSSHTGRKTFVSMMLARGVPIQDVMNMSGHQDYRSMKPYIQVDRERMKRYVSEINF
jgi:site-specific recombinase XerD